MTERKPPGVDWQTWIDRQIEAGRAEGQFDGLPGHGKPLAGIERRGDELWWVRDKLRREGVEYLPPSIAIRKKAADAAERAIQASTEAEARRIIEEINREIRQLNRLSVEGPPTTLMPFDIEEIIDVWRSQPREVASRPEASTPPEPPPQEKRRPALLPWLRRLLDG